MSENKPVCIYQSSLFTRSGYGGLSMSIAKSLLKYGKFDLKIISTKWGNCGQKHSINELSDPMEKELFERIIKQPLTRPPEIFLQCSIPNEFQTPAKFNIGITAGIETTIAKPDWVEGLNRMNLNIVTSNHAKKVFDEAIYQKQNQQGHPEGIPLKSIKPMEVLFWGADTSIYGPNKETKKSLDWELENINEDFSFLFVGQWTNNGLFNDRKDIGNLIKTFLSTFSNSGVKPKPALIIKTSGASICNMDKHDIINRLKSIRSIVEQENKTKDLPNVYILYGDLTDVEMNALYNHPKVKAHISFTHGEGFGHPLLLASLSGKPVLTSNWSGHLDFLDDKYTKLLDGELKQLPGECVNEWLIKESSWFNVNYNKASESMKNCFFYYNAHIEKSQQLANKNLIEFSIESMDKKFHSILDSYIPKFAIETKLVLPKLKKVGTQVVV